MNDMRSNIEKQVMASVAVIYGVKTLVSATALKVYALAVSVWAFGALVWVARVEQNFVQVMNGGVLAVGHYVLFAFAHTSTIVQLVSLVAIFCLGSLAIDVVKRVSTRSRYSF